MREVFFEGLYSNSRDIIIDKCVDALERGKKFIYILPSREAMFDVRSRFIDKYGGLIGTSSIFSFDNLEKVIVGYDSNTNVIDAETIVILIKQLCLELKDGGKLSFFANVIDKNGFIEEVYKIIKNLRRQNISPQKFKEVYTDLFNENGILQLKLKCDDLFEIYDAYLNALKDKNILDIDDISLMAIDKAPNCKIFEDVELFIVDGYINIDPINKNLFEEIVNAFPKIDYIFNFPFDNYNNRDFIEKELVSWLEKLNFEKGEGTFENIEVESDLKALSENLFSQDRGVIDASNSVKILNAPCIENEIRQITRIIKNKLVNDETTPEKIAIYTNNTEEYEECLEDIFGEFGIPIGISFKQNLQCQPIIRDILEVLKLDDGVELEKLNNIFSSKYLIDIKDANERAINVEKLTHVIDETFNKNDLIKNINNIIQNFDVEKYKFNLQEGVFVRDFLSTIYDLKMDSQATLSHYIDLTKGIVTKLNIKRNLINLHKSNIISSEIFIRDIKALDFFESSLGKIHASYKFCNLEEKEISHSEFIEILEEFLSNKSIVKSQNTSGIKVISPDLARGQHYDTVFIIGVNEGKYPNIGHNILFDGMQNDLFFEKNINFNNYSYELKREKIRFNLACSSALKELYISYRTSDEENGYMIKSAFLEELEGLFTEDALKAASTNSVYMRDRFTIDGDNISTIDEARDSFVSSIWQNDGQDIDKLSRFGGALNGRENDFKNINDAGKVEFSRMLNPEFDQYDGRLDSPTLKQGNMDYTFSASQINNYVKCPFGYFMKKVLDMDTFEDDGELSAVNEGKIYHKVLKDYYEKCENLYQLDENLLDTCIENTFKIINNTKLNDVIFEARKNEIKQVLKGFIEKDAGYLEGYEKQSGNKIKPRYLEDVFIDNISFANAKFKGTIDRVDIEYDQNDQPTGKFIIYDYKRSSAKTLTDCVKGGDFQLAVYYYCVVKKLQNQYKISNPECISLLYYSIEKANREGFIRKDYKKQLGLSSKRNVVAQDKFFVVLNHLKTWVEDIVENIQNGEFMLPYECDPQYCSYTSICRHDKYRVAGKN